jgi:restriction system protein
VNRIPGNREVDRALKQLARELKSALKEINQQAGRLVMRGDYTAAEGLVEVGRSVTKFGAEVDALHLRWRELPGGGKPGQVSSERTPLWEYYRPLLQALVELGGEATRSQLEEKVEPILASVLRPVEMTATSGGKLNWKRAVRRTRHHMVKEGLLEEHSGLKWRISSQGRRVAEGTTAPK